MSVYERKCCIVFIDVSISYLGYFKIGKVNKIKENDISITLFHYKLHTKSEQVVEHDVLLNFGNIGSKTIFELPDDKQSNLINRVFGLGRLFFSLTTNNGLFFLDNNFNSFID